MEVLPLVVSQWTLLNTSSNGTAPANSTKSSDDPNNLASFVAVQIPTWVYAGATLLAFCFLRRMKLFTPIYAPRASRKWRSAAVKHLSPQLPSGLLDWWPAIYRMNEQFVIKRVGLDAAIFLRFMHFGMVVFLLMTVCGLVILIPINNSAERELSDLSRLTLSNLDDQSPLLWTPTVMMYVFSILVYYMLHHHYTQIIPIVLGYHMRAYRRGQYSIMVTAVPDDCCTDEAVTDFFKQAYPHTFKSGIIARNSIALDEMVAKFRDLKSILNNAQGYADVKKKRKRLTKFPVIGDKCGSGCFFLCCCCCCGDDNVLKKKFTVDTIEHYTLLCEEAKKRIQIARRAPFPKTDTAFVTLAGLGPASQAQKTVHSARPAQWIAVEAPDPDDVYWPNMAVPETIKRVRRNWVSFAMAVLCIFWVIPVTFVSTASSLSNLAGYLPFLSFMLDMPTALRGIVEGLLPSIALSVLMGLLPGIIRFLVILSGAMSETEIQTSCMSVLFFFQIFNVFLVTTITGSITKTLNDLANNPLSFPSLLGTSLPANALFFINYIVVSGLGEFPNELARLKPMIIAFLQQRFLAVTKEQKREAMDPGEVDYGDMYSRHICNFVIIFSYSVISPLILPYGFIYFFLGYYVYKHQLCYVYTNKSESAGKMWPKVFRFILIGMFIAQVTAAGVIGLKNGPIQLGFLAALPVATYFFYSHHHGFYGHFLNGTMPLILAVEADRRKAQEEARRKEKQERMARGELVSISENSDDEGPSGKSAQVDDRTPEEIAAEAARARDANEEVLGPDEEWDQSSSSEEEGGSDSDLSTSSEEEEEEEPAAPADPAQPAADGAGTVSVTIEMSRMDSNAHLEASSSASNLSAPTQPTDAPPGASPTEGPAASPVSKSKKPKDPEKEKRRAARRKKKEEEEKRKARLERLQQRRDSLDEDDEDQMNAAAEDMAAAAELARQKAKEAASKGFSALTNVIKSANAILGTDALLKVIPGLSEKQRDRKHVVQENVVLADDDYRPPGLCIDLDNILEDDPGQTGIRRACGLTLKKRKKRVEEDSKSEEKKTADPGSAPKGTAPNLHVETEMDELPIDSVSTAGGPRSVIIDGIRRVNNEDVYRPQGATWLAQELRTQALLTDHSNANTIPISSALIALQRLAGGLPSSAAQAESDQSLLRFLRDERSRQHIGPQEAQALLDQLLTSELDELPVDDHKDEKAPLLSRRAEPRAPSAVRDRLVQSLRATGLDDIEINETLRERLLQELSRVVRAHRRAGLSDFRGLNTHASATRSDSPTSVAPVGPGVYSQFVAPAPSSRQPVSAGTFGAEIGQLQQRERLISAQGTRVPLPNEPPPPGDKPPSSGCLVM